MAATATQWPPFRSRLQRQVRERLCLLHFGTRTEDASVNLIRRFIPFHGKRYVLEKGELEVDVFLTHRPFERDVAACTQDQAPGALLFLYRAVLERMLQSGSRSAGRCGRSSCRPY